MGEASGEGRRRTSKKAAALAAQPGPTLTWTEFMNINGPSISKSRMNDSESSKPGSFSRRLFFKTIGTTAVATATVQVQTVAAELEKINAEKVIGPGTVPVTL